METCRKFFGGDIFQILALVQSCIDLALASYHAGLGEPNQVSDLPFASVFFSALLSSLFCTSILLSRMPFHHPLPNNL